MQRMLPKLTDASIMAPQASRWTESDVGFLDNLSKSMEINGDFSQSGKISSIPDVWAKPLLFEMALYDNANSMGHQFSESLHKRVVGEWRCLLAMLALKEARHLDLQAVSVQLKEGNSSIDDVLFKMKPTKSIDDGVTSWNEIYLLILNGKTIAMTTPTTLVCSAADYERIFAGSIPTPWSEDGKFMSDPTSRLTKGDKAMVYGWINNLIAGIRENTLGENLIKNSILNALQQYSSDLSHGIGNQTCEYVDSELNMYYGIYSLLNTTAKMEIDPNASDVIIKPSVGRTPGASWLMADPVTLSDMARTWSVPKSELMVWGGYTANDITESKLDDSNRSVIGATNLLNNIYVRPSDIFTEKVFLITLTSSDESLFAGVYNFCDGDSRLKNDHREIIPPIRKKVLDYFTPADLKNMLNIEYTGAQVKASLNITFTNGKKYKVSKTYDLKDRNKSEFINSITEIPNAELWPNMRIDNWHKYYFCYINTAMDKKDIAVDTPFLEPWSYENRELTKGLPTGGMGNVYVAQLYEFPEAFVCNVFSKIDGSMQHCEVGVLLTKELDVHEIHGGNEWDIGIDFGTSSTMLYYTDKRHRPKPLSFESRLFSVTKSNDFLLAANMARRFIAKTNFQSNTIAGSFLTIYQTINNDLSSNSRINPLIDGRIFPLSVERIEDFNMLGYNILPNLKWDTDITSRRKAESYIEQVCLQCAVEAAANGVKNISWNFSYPSAFSDNDRSGFETMTERAVDNAVKNTYYENASKYASINMESIATAKYFNKLGSSTTNFVEGAICLDIGAGTTDISIISGKPGRIVYHTSVQYAGRYLFKSIYKWFGDQIELGNTFGEAHISGISFDNIDEDHKALVLDATMREYSDVLLEQLSVIRDDESGENGNVIGTLQINQIAMAGLFYYVGIILGELHRRGIYRENHVPDIYVGGNGSRAFYWLIGGGHRFKSNDNHVDLLRKVILEASGLPAGIGNIGIYLSEEPKIEVAAGMLAEDLHHELFDEQAVLESIFGIPENGKEIDPIVALSVISGEEYEHSGITNEANEFISAYDIKQGLNIDSLSNLEKMISCINNSVKSLWGGTIDFTDMDIHYILKYMKGYYIEEMTKEIKDIRVEPVFLVAMKALLELKIETMLEEHYDE